MSYRPEQGVVRLTFNLAAGTSLSNYSDLSFDLSEIEPGSISASLTQGDVGLPEVRIVTSAGSVWRFKRGNHKDFFDLQRPGETQRINLPLRYFQFDNDTRNNVSSTEAFTKSEAKSIQFDFLASKTRDISIRLENPALILRPTPENRLRLFEVARLEGTLKSITPFYANDGQISFSLVLDQAFFSPLLHKAVLRVLVHDQDGTEAWRREKSIDNLNQFVWLLLPSRGYFSAELSVVCGDAVLASETVGCGWGVNSGVVRDSIMGISDIGFEDAIGLMGGRYQRSIALYRDIALPSQWAPARWTGRVSPLPTCLPIPAQDVIVALKSMPNIISKRKDEADSHRYGPSDFAEFAKYVAFVAEDMSRSGFMFLEPWNEASVRYEWNDDIETLIEVYRTVYVTVKGIDPRIQILPGTTHTFDFAFLERILESGAGRYMDGLAIHGYTYQTAALADDIARVPALLKSFAGRHGNPDSIAEAPIYITEIGFRSPAFSLFDQAKWLSTATLLASCHSSYRGVLWFRMENRYDAGLAEYDQNQSTGYAMVEYGKRGIRPSLLAYRMTAAFLNLFPNGLLEASEAPRSFRFIHRSKDGQRQAVALVGDIVQCKVPAGMTAMDAVSRVIGREGEEISTTFSPVYLVPNDLTNILARGLPMVPKPRQASHRNAAG